MGCRHGAKNTLDRNYLWLAERKGVAVQPDTEVRWVRPLSEGSVLSMRPELLEEEGPTGGGEEARFEVTARRTNGAFRSPELRFSAKNVIFAGGVLGTVELLTREGEVEIAEGVTAGQAR